MDFRPLLDERLPLEDRCKLFNEGIDKMGPQDAQTLSYRMKVPPEIVTAYYELNAIDDGERGFLASKRLDVHLLGVLLNLAPENRKAVYVKIDEFVTGPHPVSAILAFVKGGLGRMTVRELYSRVEHRFWGSVATVLHDRGIDTGSLNRSFRAVLVRISRRDASEGELQWLERGLRTDAAEGLEAFTAPSLRDKFPEAVKVIEQYRS